MWGEQRGREGEEVEGDEEELIEGADGEEDILAASHQVSQKYNACLVELLGAKLAGGGFSNLVCVIKIQKPATALVHVLMARVDTSDDEGGVHVHVVAGKVDGDEALEENGPAGPGGREEDEEARGSATIGHHVEDGAEAG